MHSLPQLIFLIGAIVAALAFIVTLLGVSIYVELGNRRDEKQVTPREVSPAQRPSHTVYQ